MKTIKKNQLIFIILLLLSTALLLPGCFSKEKILYDTSTDNALMINENGNISSTSTTPLELEPGVYKVVVNTNFLPEEAQLVIDFSYDQNTTFFKSVRYNPVVLFQGENYTDFEIYVQDKISNACLQLVLYNDEFENIHSITINKTPLANRILLAICYVALLFLYLVIRLREKIVEKSIAVSRQIAIAGISFCIIISFLPYLNDYFTVGADTTFHLLRIESLKETILHANQFPIRVSDYWLYGHGYMNSTFYGDLLLYIPAFMRLLGFPLSFVAKSFVFLSILAIAIVSFHCIYRCTKNDYAATLGSGFILLSPYLFHNIYNRGALGEYSAMIFLPLIFTGMFLLYTEENKASHYKSYKWYLIVGLSFILQCHLITCEITGTLIIVFCLINYKKTFQKETFVQLLQAVGLILMINASFWFPLVHMMVTDTFFFHNLKDLSIQAAGVQMADFLQITAYKGGIPSGMYNSNILQPGLALLVSIGLFILYANRTKKDTIRNYCKNTLMLLLVLIIMSTKYFPWDLIGKIPGLSFFSNAIQFPYRLLSPIVIIGGFFIAFLTLWSKKNFTKLVHGLVIVMLVLFSLIPSLFQTNNFVYSTEPLRIYSAKGMGSISIAVGEYLLSDSVKEDYHAHPPICGEGIITSDYYKKGTEITLKVQNLSSQDSYIDLPLIGYHGYVVNKPLSISEVRGYNNDLRISVPANYSGTLHVAYKEMTLYLIADIVSLLTLLGLLVYAGSIMKKKGEEK